MSFEAQDTDRGEMPIVLGGGRFVLSGVIGRGSQADVHRAIDTWNARRTVAIKLLKANSLPHLRERFRAEADWLAHHPSRHVLRVHATGTDGGRDWIAMDYCPAGTLRTQIVRDGALEPVAAIEATLEILGALRHAHGTGIVHRDVKPSNLMIGHGGHVRLADFGIAQHSQHRFTETGAVLGSMSFAAPEQRLDSRGVTPASDIYSTGATLCRLLTLGNTMDLFTAEADSPRFEGIPGPLVRVIRRAVRFDPAERFASSGEMALALLEAARRIAPERHAHLVEVWEASADPEATEAPPSPDVRPPVVPEESAPGAARALAVAGVLVFASVLFGGCFLF